MFGGGIGGRGAYVPFCPFRLTACDLYAAFSIYFIEGVFSCNIAVSLRVLLYRRMIVRVLLFRRGS